MGSFLSKAQEKIYSLESFPSEFFFAYDSDQKPSIYTDSLHFHLTEKGFVSHPIKGFFKDIEFENQKIQKDFSLLETPEGQHMILNGLGIVIKVDENGFTRLDRSSELRNNFNAIMFYYDNKIFCHGGYGYWQYHDYIVYYNFGVQEWKSYPVSSSFKPNGRAYHFGAIAGDNYVFFGGQTQDGFLKSIERLNFLENNYEYLGTLSSDFEFANTRPLPIMPWGEGQNLYYHLTNNKLLLVDYNTLKFRLSEPVSGLFNDIDHFFPVLSANDSLYYITQVSDNKRSLVSISKKDLEAYLGDWKDLLSLWDKIKPFFLAGVYFLIFLIISRSIYLLNKKSKLIRQSVLLQGHYLNFRSDIIILEDKQLAILKYVIANGIVDINDFSKLAVFEKLSESYQKQIVAKNIDKLISVIKDSPEISKAISLKMIQDKKDRRRKILKLKGHILIYNGWFNFLVKEFT